MDKATHARTVAVDFDGTLAHYEKFVAPDNLGEPIPEMVRKVKAELAKGTDVVIFTARVNPGQGSGQDALDATLAFVAIAEWSKKVFGKVLPITHEKSRHFVEIWDDRAKEIVQNTGVFATDVIAAHGSHR